MKLHFITSYVIMQNNPGRFTCSHIIYDLLCLLNITLINILEITKFIKIKIKSCQKKINLLSIDFKIPFCNSFLNFCCLYIMNYGTSGKDDL